MTKFICFLVTLPILLSCQPQTRAKPYVLNNDALSDKEQVAIFAGGCFWCVEAPLALLDGVDTVISGYIGGHVDNPTYIQVTRGATGHAEAVKIVFHPEIISYDELLEAFFQLHDPTQLNRQGNDVGTQYRSAIFPLDVAQREKAKYYIHKLNEVKAYDKPIVTTIEEATVFYPAEDYHQDYYNKNPEDRYCQLVARPKMEKFKKVFADKLKK